MPTVNIYYQDEQWLAGLEKATGQLKQFVADKLSGKDIQLKTDEVSVRLLPVKGSMLAPVEAEINAAAFKERVDKQDQICLDIQKFLIDTLQVSDAKVWLVLSELGHSWQNT